MLKITSCTLGPVASNPADKGIATIDLTVAGVKKSYLLHLVEVEETKEMMRFKGSRVLLFSDFNLKPPSQMLGTVKAKDEMLMSFNLVMRKIAS